MPIDYPQAGVSSVGQVYLRQAIPADADGMATVFGTAFDDYRRGLGVDAVTLVAMWHPSFSARGAVSTVAVSASGDVVGFIISVPPGAEEFGRDGRPRDRPRFPELMGWNNMWRLPATFGPMGLAFARRRTRPDEGYVSMLAVRPDWQGKGVARSLLLAVEGAMVRAGASGVLLHTAARNEAALKAYRRSGYRVVRMLRSPWTDPAGIDAYVAMRKDVAATVPLNR